MPSLPREQLEDWVERWLQANRDAEHAGDWTPLADFYTDDATYGWNIGPKEDVMCVGKDEIRDVALGLEMEGLENWVYEYQKVLIDEKLGEIVGFWKQIVNKIRRHQGRDLRHRRQLVPARMTDLQIEWQRDFFDFGHVSYMFGKLIESGDLSAGMQKRIERSHGRREVARLLPARRGAGRRSGDSRPSGCLGVRVTHLTNGSSLASRALVEGEYG